MQAGVEGHVAYLPFSDVLADVILRSSNGVSFRVHSRILCEASPTCFEGMFSIPPPKDAQNDTLDGLPFIDCTEDDSTLDKLLRICYPTTDPSFQRLNDVEAVMEAATKYDMEHAQEYCMKELFQARFLDTNPISVFAVVYEFDMISEAKVAAKATLHLDSAAFVRCMQTSPIRMLPSAIVDLVGYRDACGRAVTRALQRDSWNKVVLGQWHSSPLGYIPCDECDDYSGFSEYVDGLDADAYHAFACQLLNPPEAPIRPKDLADQLSRAARRDFESSFKDNCSTCQQALLREVTSFSEHVARTIDACINKVPFILSF
ncbi:hypothetical protein WOLCODRAFT_140325 [Wolfiporia cocos MD-104 SS10]|uniref:BTB domain-containing protein n=1 Tax=Wolfiporia cocos (strain MD-104) TaxID=742152 RepID=A0A2H3JJX1_WOLCO|nr:hypothetical protein WOLCODRAFT_140325 [Wolfiporia cocos MD-104 SS10]